MKGRRLEQTPLGGVSELIPQPDDAATEIVNFTVHNQTGGWDNRIGYEKYFSSSTGTFAPFDYTGRIDSLFIWSRHQGAQQWVIFEADGALYYVEDYGLTSAIEVIEEGRTIPAVTEAAASYAPYGRFLYVVNGNDAPVRYAAWPHGRDYSSVPSYQVGWHSLPSAPSPWGVQTRPEDGAEYAGSVAIWATGTDPRRIPWGTIGTDVQYRTMDWEAAWSEVGLGDEKPSNMFTLDSDGDRTTTLADDRAFSSYRYKVSFINNAGSESPVSEASPLVIWYQPEEIKEGTTYYEPKWPDKRWIVGLEIPTGPDGTIARRIYRTKDLGDGTERSEVYYYVSQVGNNTETFWFDSVGDNQLITVAPSDADSVIFPSSATRFCSVFKDCMFIDGGSSNETAVFWSKPGFPDSYTSTDYVDVGAREGGGITGFHAHYNYLLILRQRSIDYIYGDYPNFRFAPLSQSIGTAAAGAINTIPDLGVIFLANDGVYVVHGGFEGGATVEIKRISDPIMKTIERMNKDVLARAVACYSHKWKEWHCYFAADGHDRPNLGIVLHLDKMAWSVRERFPVGAASTTFDGDIVFGHVDGYTGDTGQAGLFVISAARTLGEVALVGSEPAQGENQGSVVLADNEETNAKYRSKWHDFGDPNKKKKVHYVYLYVLTEGDNPIPLTYFKDYDYVGTAAPSAKPQVPDAASQGVYDSVFVNKDVWEEERLTELRYPISQGSCSNFQFEVQNKSDLVLVGYAIELTSPEGTKIIKGKRV